MKNLVIPSISCVYIRYDFLKVIRLELLASLRFINDPKWPADRRESNFRHLSCDFGYGVVKFWLRLWINSLVHKGWLNEVFSR